MPCGEDPKVSLFLRYDSQRKSYILAIRDDQPYGFFRVFGGEKGEVKLEHENDKGFFMEESSGKFSKKISITLEGNKGHLWDFFWKNDPERQNLKLRFKRKDN
jgi:hypothetical protein